MRFVTRNKLTRKEYDNLYAVTHKASILIGVISKRMYTHLFGGAFKLVETKMGDILMQNSSSTPNKLLILRLLCNQN